MTHPTHYHENLIFSPGTQVVALRDVVGQNGRTLHPRGAVGVVVRAPLDLADNYRVRFPDGVEEPLKTSEVALLAKHKEGDIGNSKVTSERNDLYERVILQCIIGSQAYGLSDSESDIDRRGIYLPPADLHWSLYGVPEQLECEKTQEAYWELQKFIVLALKANPNVLECLYSPLVEKATPLAKQLLAQREMFLSRLVYQTFNGYVLSQFKKMQADLRNQGQVKWKHVMHLIRLLICGTRVLNEGTVQVEVGEHREQLLAIKRGEMPWGETERWRRQLHVDFDTALANTRLPERPDYERANSFLLQARRAALSAELP
ncbi:nucleotidyltransferase domain-containing protein [Bremerella sp. JC817]|uniref:nucleotidyltransferase domain-containing protein n=1 Tax=Bremerella sp. JC817 TaxID=3231756 RepID=UPI00345A0B0A